MHNLETTRTRSGAWTVHYQTGLPDTLLKKYQGVIKYIGDISITNVDYNLLVGKQRSSDEAVEIFTRSLSQLFKLRRFGFQVYKDTELVFNGATAAASSNGISLERQKVLRISLPDFPSYSALIDPTCYLHGIEYNRMPIAVGDPDYLERLMSEVYSELTQSQVEIKISTS